MNAGERLLRRQTELVQEGNDTPAFEAGVGLREDPAYLIQASSAKALSVRRTERSHEAGNMLLAEHLPKGDEEVILDSAGIRRLGRPLGRWPSGLEFNVCLQRYLSVLIVSLIIVHIVSLVIVHIVSLLLFSFSGLVRTFRGTSLMVSGLISTEGGAGTFSHWFWSGHLW